MLQFMGLQRVGHNWVTELNWTELNEAQKYREEDKKKIIPKKCQLCLQWSSFLLFKGKKLLQCQVSFVDSVEEQVVKTNKYESKNGESLLHKNPGLSRGVQKPQVRHGLERA